MTELLVVPRWRLRSKRHFDLLSAIEEPVGGIEGTSVRLALVDVGGRHLASFERPRSFFRTVVRVRNASGTPVGAATRRSWWGRLGFVLTDGAGAPAGALDPEGMGAHRFNVLGPQGQTTGRVERRFGIRPSRPYRLSVAGDPHDSLRVLAAIVAVHDALSGGPDALSGGHAAPPPPPM